MPFLIALLAGAVSALSFAPVGLWPLMPLSIALLCELIARQPRRRGAMALGWAYGAGQFAVGLNWIATAFTFQAAMPAWLGWVAVVLLSLYLALYPMLATGLAWTFGRERPLALVLALAGGWGIAEWLRATLFTGFAWNPLGAVLVDTPWRATSAYLGTYGLSMLVVLAGAMGWLAWRRMPRAPLAFAALAGLLLLLPRPAIVPAAPTGGQARIVQPDIGQADKWSAGFAEIAAARLARLSRAPGAPAGPAGMLFWPEAAVTEPLDDQRRAAAPFVAAERRQAVATLRPGQLLATGGLGFTSSDGDSVDGATNSVFVLDSAGAVVARYDKAHLVPYGEYLPMRPLLSAIGLSRLAPGDMDFRPGPGARTLTLPNRLRMGVQICYEIIFSGAVIDASARPDFLFNPSNDAWFGAWGPPQHLAQARLRAAEEAMAVIRATPTGISALIDPHGALLLAGAAGRPAVLDGALPGTAAPTLFARTGNALPLGLGFALLIAAIALARRRRYSAI